MVNFKLLTDHFAKERASLVRALENAKETRDGAPSAMESHHDTTRNQTEKLVIALEEDLTILDKNISLIPTDNPEPSDIVSLWSYVELDFDGKPMKLIIVPEGMGGSEAGGIKLVSEQTPLGKILINSNHNDHLFFSDKQIRILQLS